MTDLISGTPEVNGNGQLTLKLFEGAGIAVTDIPRVEPPVQVPNKVCSCKPSSIIQAGKVALDRLEQNRSFQDWVDVIHALAELQSTAMNEAMTNKPHGPKYRKAITKKLRLYEFHRVHRTTRSFLLKTVLPDLEAMRAWRAKQPSEVQLDLNHPRIVFTRWKRSQKPKPPRPDPNNSENNELDIETESVELDQAWQAASEKQRKKFFEKLGKDAVKALMPVTWREEFRELALDNVEVQAPPKLRAGIRRMRKRSKVIDHPPIT